MVEVIYADHAATSPMHEEVVQAMFPYFQTYFGNPSSIHQVGRKARQAVEHARMIAANALSVSDKSIIFTSGGTEAANMAILGYALANETDGKHIITTKIEHHAVLHACEELSRRGYDVTYLPVDETGRIDIEDVKKALREDTILVSCMFANNEIGTIQPIKEIGELLQNHQAAFHTDAVQAFGSIPIDLSKLHVDLLNVSAHKINGPKGVGFLYVKEGVTLHPLFYGGEQEKKRRAGTENVASIVGFGKAIELSQRALHEKKARYERFIETLTSTWTKEGITFVINGDRSNAVPHILNVSFPGVNIESLLTNFDLEGIAASSGSACTAGTTQPSHVLVAMFGNEHERVTSAVRFSFGLGNTEEQINELAKRTAVIVKRLQQDEQFIR